MQQWRALFCLLFLLCICYLHYLTSLSSMMLIWAAGAICKWRAHLHNRMPLQRLEPRTSYSPWASTLPLSYPVTYVSLVLVWLRRFWFGEVMIFYSTQSSLYKKKYKKKLLSLSLHGCWYNYIKIIQNLFHQSWVGYFEQLVYQFLIVFCNSYRWQKLLNKEIIGCTCIYAFNIFVNNCYFVFGLKCSWSWK